MKRTVNRSAKGRLWFFLFMDRDVKASIHNELLRAIRRVGSQILKMDGAVKLKTQRHTVVSVCVVVTFGINLSGSPPSSSPMYMYYVPPMIPSSTAKQYSICFYTSRIISYARIVLNYR